jgi:hypothetical protein
MTDRLEAYAAFARMMITSNFSAVGRQMQLSQGRNYTKLRCG